VRLLPLLLVHACSEYDLSERTPDPLGGDDTAPAETVPEEDLPPDCTVALADAVEVPIEEECTVAAVDVEDPWAVEIEWQWRGLSTDPDLDQVMMLPVVGNLTDDDGDGLITESDVPDIVAIAFDGADGWSAENVTFSAAPATLVLLESSSGAEQWSLPGFYWKGGPAIADVTGDGRAEIIAFDDEMHVVAVSGEGEILWTSDVSVDYAYPHVNVADLDADGTPEVLADTLVLDGATGALEQSFTVPFEMMARMPAAADLDLDGFQELIIGSTLYSHDGTERWTSTISGTYGHWVAILDADDDIYGEVAMIGNGELAIYDTDGSILSRSPAGTEQPGPPCVADFDGDGEAEIGWASSSLFNLYELDGTVIWTRAITDATGLAGCSGYDVDGDGAYEVFYADENTFFIFDGVTGLTNYSITGHASGTIFEYPIVADIDRDGSAEVVMVSNNFRQDGDGWAGVTVLGHAENGWAASGPTWNVHDFAVTNIEQDGTVPRLPEPSWLIYNAYRSRPAIDAVAVDLYADITDVCYAGCAPDDVVRVAVQVLNQGATRARSGLPVSLFRRDGNSLTAIGLAYTADTIDPGAGLPGIEIAVLAGWLEGADAIEARADDLGAGFGLISECDEWNNGGLWADLECGDAP